MSNEMKLLSICVQTGLYGGRNIPFMLQGLPGIAKTQVITALGQEMEKLLQKPYPVEVFTAPQRLPEEVGGIPVAFYEEREVVCLPMRLGKQLLAAGQGCAFVDEFGSATQAMGGALMTMIQDGRLGDLTLPNAVARGAAMNPPDCAVAGRSLTAPESNRFCWIDWNLQFDDWVDYMRGGRGAVRSGVILSPTWETDFGMQAKNLIISYLRRNQERFNVQNTMPKAHDASQAWASPRSWENAARLLAACLSLKESPSSDLAMLAISGCIGDADATTFLQWYTQMDLPDPEEILRDPNNAANLLPKHRSDQLQVALESVAAAACTERPDREDRWVTAWNILEPYLINKPDCAFYAGVMLSEGAKFISASKRGVPQGAIMRKIMNDSGLIQE